MLDALGSVMKAQYEAVVHAGFLPQLDCPDLALSRHTVFAHLSLREFRGVIERHVEVLNEAMARSHRSACGCTSAGAARWRLITRTSP